MQSRAGKAQSHRLGGMATGGLSRLMRQVEVRTRAFSSTQLVFVFCLVHLRTCLSVQETERKQVRSLGQEDPVEEGMATLSSILAWKIPLTEEPGRLQSMGSHRIRHV